MNIKLLADKEFVVFSTREYAQTAGLSIAAASKQLKRRANESLITQITRGLWANTRHPLFSPLACVPHLLGPEQGYVSFLTALHHHGLLSQIPATIQVATTGHGRKLATAAGTFEFLQLKPELMWDDIEWSEAHLPYRIANAEKALIDTLYIATRKQRRFASLPELEFEETPFDEKRFHRLLNRIELPSPIRIAIKTRFATLNQTNSTA